MSRLWAASLFIQWDFFGTEKVPKFRIRGIFPYLFATIFDEIILNLEQKIAFWGHTGLPHNSWFQYSRYFDRKYLPQITRAACTKSKGVE